MLVRSSGNVALGNMASGNVALAFKKPQPSIEQMPVVPNEAKITR